MTSPHVLSRADFVAALSDGAGAGPVAAHLAPIFDAHTAIAVERRFPHHRVMMWIAPTVTVIATGDDPVTVTRIRAANTLLAVLDSIDLRPRGAQRRGSWWQVRITSDDDRHRIEGYDRSPGPTWLVTDGPGTTTVRRATLDEVVRTVCDALDDDRNACSL